MKKIIAVFTAFSLLALLPGCAGVTAEPAAVTEAPAGDAATRSDSRAETQPLTHEAAEEPAGASEQEEDRVIVRETEAVTYPETGIPIANAYFSFRLPADWDGRYLCETSYVDDVMFLLFRHRESADEGMDGTLFRLALVPAGSAFDASAGRILRTISDDGGTYTLYVIDPPEEPFSPDTAEEYAAMRKQVDAALETLEPGAGCRF